MPEEPRFRDSAECQELLSALRTEFPTDGVITAEEFERAARGAVKKLLPTYEKSIMHPIEQRNTMGFGDIMDTLPPSYSLDMLICASEAGTIPVFIQEGKSRVVISLFLDELFQKVEKRRR